MALLAACSKPPPDDLPPIPQLEFDEFPLAVREQLTAALAAVEETPYKPAVNGRLGILLRLYEQPGQATVFLQRAHMLAPESFQWLYYLGELHVYQGRHADAVAVLGRALEEKPGHPSARIQLGEALLAQGELEAAADTYRALIDEHPDFGEGHFGIGRVLLQQGDAQAAVTALLKTLDITGPFGRAYYLLASARRQLGQADQARADLELYERYRNVVPPGNDRLMGQMQALNRSDQPLVAQAKQLGAEGRIDEAIGKLLTALELNPDSMAAHTSLVGIYGSRGQYELAEKHYALASAIDPGVAKLQYNLGVLRLSEERLVEAKAAFERAAEINPQDADTFAQLGVVCEMRKEFAEAAVHYRRALEVAPAHRQSHWQLGRLLNAQARHEEAIVHLEQATEPRSPVSAMIRRELAKAYVAVGNDDSAVATLQAGLQDAAEYDNAKETALIRRELRALGAATQ